MHMFSISMEGHAMKTLKTASFIITAIALFGTVSGQAFAEGDPVAGAKVFKKCVSCHNVVGKSKVGPALNGVMGRTAGTGEGFKYSKAMIAAGEAGMVWDDATLSAYLANPRKAIKGNKMAFIGLKKPEDQANVIAYIKAESE